MGKSGICGKERVKTVTVKAERVQREKIGELSRNFTFRLVSAVWDAVGLARDRMRG
jgi:hypothetical protein